METKHFVKERRKFAPQIRLKAKQIVYLKDKLSAVEHIWFLDADPGIMYLRQVIGDNFGPAGSWRLKDLHSTDSLFIDFGQDWRIVSGVREAVNEAYQILEVLNKKPARKENIHSQAEIIKALHNNKCPLCVHEHMCADVVHSYGKKHKVAYFVECLFCSNRWEITKEIFENEVKVSETKSYKLEYKGSDGTDKD